MPATVHLSRKDLIELIERTKADGNDASLFEQLLDEVNHEKQDKNKPRSLPMEKEVSPQELVTSATELERLRSLACPHIRNSPYWETFVERRILVCNSCKEMRPGEFGEQRQPPLL